MTSTPTVSAVKACPVVTLGGAAGEVLVFRHPLAGMQIVKGTVEAGEAPADAARRELFEEAGIRASVSARIGSSATIAEAQVWHFFRCVPDGPLPERWVHHAADDGGHDFAFEWWPLLRRPLAADWQPIFIRALAFLAGRLA